MCKFCKKSNTLELEIRSTYADDNSCYDDSCDDCKGCSNTNLAIQYSKNTSCISLEYFKSKKGIINHPFSESLHINYCPFCGNKLSEDVLEVLESINYIGKLRE